MQSCAAILSKRLSREIFKECASAGWLGCAKNAAERIDMRLSDHRVENNAEWPGIKFH
jgi:hypothetical protein